MIPDSNNRPERDGDGETRRQQSPPAPEQLQPGTETAQSETSNLKSGIPAPLLIVEALEKRFGEVVVLRGINMEVTRGGISAVVGPNGAGKTTLFHVISGDIRPDRGAILFNNQTLNGSPPWKIARMGLGKLFQDVRVFGNLTILENVLLATHSEREQGLLVSLAGGLYFSKRQPQAVERARECLSMTGVEEPWDRPARELSFGNQKLLALARLMAGDFQLLLLDEPTAGVSPAMAKKMETLLHRLADEEGMTILLIEHNFSFVQATAAHTVLMRAGEIMDAGPTGQVLGKEENREVLIGL